MGAAAGGLFASFDRGIKQKLLKELGENMTASESAVAILVESADWPVAVERMKAHGFGGTLVLSEIVEQDEAEVDALLADPKKVESAPAILDVVAVGAAVESVAAVEPEETVVVAAATTGGYAIAEIEGIGATYADQLGAVGIRTTDALLARAGSAAGRATLAAETGISEALLLAWVNRADLMRIPGVGSQYSDLLEAAGVDSPAELARRNPANLAVTVQEVIAARPGIVRRTPSESEISDWVKAAGGMDKVVQH
jgi:predicted flap endonuclease-1-like 5' DNA nuclease